MDLPEIEKLLDEKVKIKGGLFLGDADAATKLVDLKIGKDVGVKLSNLSTSIDKLNTKLDEMTNKTIASNKNLADSNGIYSVAMCVLTFGLLVVAILQGVLMFYQYRVVNEQKILSEDPIVEIFPSNGFVNGKNFIFSLPLRNLGISDVRDINIYEDYYIATNTKNGLLVTKVGPTFLNRADVHFDSLKQNELKNFIIDFQDGGIKKQFDEMYPHAGGVQIGRIKVSYRRVNDNKKYSFQVLFQISVGEYALIFDQDQREEEMPHMPGLPSIQEIKTILG